MKKDREINPQNLNRDLSSKNCRNTLRMEYKYKLSKFWPIDTILN